MAADCVYDLSDSERRPILQVEALRARDKEIERLKRQVAALGGLSSKATLIETRSDMRKKRKSVAESRIVRKRDRTKQKSVLREEISAGTSSLKASPATGITTDVCYEVLAEGPAYTTLASTLAHPDIR